MLNVLHLQTIDVDKIYTELKMKRDVSPQFFMRIPIIIDCAGLVLDDTKNTISDLFGLFSSLKKAIHELGFTLIGIRNQPESMKKLLLNSGWTIMPNNAKVKPSKSVNKANQEQKNSKEKQNVISTEPPTKGEPEQKTIESTGKIINKPSLMIDRPVRSGQQIYAAGSDLTVLSATSAGSEVMADGSIHVYGALRGRVLAGVKGNESARIFCQSLQAELIVIAGRYQLLDESDTNLIGKPAMIHLNGEKLIIEPLA